RRWMRLLLLPLVLAGGFVVYRAVPGRAAPTAPAAVVMASPVHIRFECRNATLGWSAIAEWPTISAPMPVAWSSAAGGPWVAAAPFGSSAVRDGLPPSVPVWVRVGGLTASATAPATPC